MAAGGYPDKYRSGDPIAGLDVAARLPGKIFHSGTRLDAAGRVVTSGGRVLCAVGTGNSVRAAQLQAYELVSALRFAGAHYRRDIGHRAAVREAAEAR
jgi:phosphoribosylamine--glycine ligase